MPKTKKAVIKIKRDNDVAINIHFEIDTGNIEKLFQRLHEMCSPIVVKGDTLDSIYFYEEETYENP